MIIHLAFLDKRRIINGIVFIASMLSNSVKLEGPKFAEKAYQEESSWTTAAERVQMLSEMATANIPSKHVHPRQNIAPVSKRSKDLSKDSRPYGTRDSDRRRLLKQFIRAADMNNKTNITKRLSRFPQTHRKLGSSMEESTSTSASNYYDALILCRFDAV
jgi:hypothetical protein